MDHTVLPANNTTPAFETLQAEICRRARFLKGVGHFDRPLKVEGDVAHEPLLGGRKLERLPFHMV